MVLSHSPFHQASPSVSTSSLTCPWHLSCLTLAREDRRISCWNNDLPQWADPGGQEPFICLIALPVFRANRQRLSLKSFSGHQCTQTQDGHGWEEARLVPHTHTCCPRDQPRAAWVLCFLGWQTLRISAKLLLPATRNANKRSGQAHSRTNKPARSDVQTAVSLDVQTTSVPLKLKIYTLVNARCIAGI